MGFSPGATHLQANALSWIGRTPVVKVLFRIDRRWHRICLKLEQRNPGGSIKDRTAYALIDTLEINGTLRPGKMVTESTSGNLGVALAYICSSKGYRFVAVVDPKASVSNIETIRRLGGAIEVVGEPDEDGSYLGSRLLRVQHLLSSDPDFVWTNQYANPANPRVHFEQTGPEILRQCVTEPDVVFVAVSTGGTLAGISRYFRAVAPCTKIVAVDVHGSRALGGRSGSRLLNGIGASQQSIFLRPDDYDSVMHIRDTDAIGVCHAFRSLSGMGLGGSSGAVLAACTRYLAQYPEVAQAVCVCPDGEDRYQETIYDFQWLRAHGVDPATLPAPVFDACAVA